MLAGTAPSSLAQRCFRRSSWPGHCSAPLTTKLTLKVPLGSIIGSRPLPAVGEPCRWPAYPPYVVGVSCRHAHMPRGMSIAKTSSYRVLGAKHVSVAIVHIVPHNKSIDQVLFCTVTSARMGSPPWAVAGRLLSRAVAPHMGCGGSLGRFWVPPALFLF
jgi:hypothetical protein